MSANESFFLRRKAAAAFKHGILSTYPIVFLAKAGSTTNGRVVFLDGYAGKGKYDDGTPGSPALFVKTARGNPNRTVTAVFVERDPEHYASLLDALREADPDDRVKRVTREGDLGLLLPELLPIASGAALFAFLDPFGTALDFSQLREQLLQRPGRAPTEVLLHFSVSTIARMGGVLNAAISRGGVTIPERKTIAHADAFLGGTWWQAEFDLLRAALPPVTKDGINWVDIDDEQAATEAGSSALATATDVALRVAHEFCARVSAQTGFRAVSMPVRPEPGHVPKYVLVLFTRNDHGVWFFADALGRAGRMWQQAVYEERIHKDAEKLEAHLADDFGLFSLEELRPTPPPPFDRDQYERDNRTAWQDTIAANLHRLFAEHGNGLRLVDHASEVYGEVLGQAWERHVRAAVKRLHNGGFITDDGKGDDFWKRRIMSSIPQQQTDSPAVDLSREDAG